MDRNGGASRKPATFLDQRERAADRREVLADWRECTADWREHEADWRERRADWREHTADEREALADQREDAADEREEQIRELIGELRGLVTGAHRDALEAIERSQTLPWASASRVGRREEAGKRADARSRREQAAITRAAARSERQLARPSLARQELSGQATAMRARLSATAFALAAIEDNAAYLFDQLAAGRPERGSAYQQRAEEARGGARRARAISRELDK
jgi:hypothetical protein